MWEVSINYWAVLVAAISAMVVGFVWYSMSVFGRPWMAAIGKTEEDIKAGYNPLSMVWTYVFAAITAYVLAHFLQLLNIETVSEALTMTAWLWLGFVLMVMATNAIYEGRSTKLLAINSLYQLVTMLVMAVILVSWR